MKWLTLLLLPLCGQAQPSAPQIARTAADEFVQGRLDDFRVRFSQQMAEETPAARLALAHGAFLPLGGRFLRSRGPDCTAADGFQVCEVTFLMTQRDVTLSLAIDRDGRIASLSQRFHSGLFSAFGIPPFMDNFLLPILFAMISWLPFHFLPRSFPPLTEDVAILRRYHRWNNGLAVAIALLTMALGLVYSSSPIIAGTFLHSLCMIFVFVHVRRAWPHLLPEDSVRIAGLVPAEPLPRWMWPIWALPALILAGVTWYLAAHWDAIPVSTPIHWGPDAQPDRWETRTFKNVFGFLLMGWSILLASYTYGALIVWGGRRNAITTRLVHVLIGFLSLMQISLIVPLALVSLVLSTPLSEFTPEPVLLSSLLPLICAIAGLVIMKREMGKLPLSRDAAPRECWRAGVFYVNPSDPAWMVRNGMGFSPNFGHAWILVLTLLLQTQMIGTIIYVAT